MKEKDVRTTLDRLIRNRGEDYASISRLLGRNPTYIQQFVKRGVPKRLREDDRQVLARHFGVSETLLGAPTSGKSPAVFLQNGDPKRPRDFVTVPALDLRATAGHSSYSDERLETSNLAFKASWIRQLASGSIDALSLIRVEGDSMQPSLNHGDQVLVDTQDRLERLRDGIYVLNVNGVLLVKRLAINPSTRTLTLVSDNPAYPNWDNCDQDTVTIIGRVVWASRRLG